uniref:Neutrophil cytosolic factor 2 n=1 Tax=Sinocyclocheilus grahami TaxID=75366 RepID=A0A672JUG9_SINGR
MSFVSTLRQWDKAVACVEQRDPDSALRIFLNIEEKSSKIFFNIGCLYLNNSELDEAEKAFDRSIGKDEHLPATFFQRQVTFYKKERFKECLLDFQQAFKQLRGNQLIDYKPLGLRYKLCACEVLHNIGVVQAQLGKWERAQENLLTALSLRADDKFRLRFKPNKNYVAELEKKDYLGKAKVVSSVVPADDFSGFDPLQPQADNVPSTPKVPEVLRVFEGGPHTVLYEFYPETKEELAVLPGNIVLVLQKGADNWASVVFNEKWGLVPYNFLEPLDIVTMTSTPMQLLSASANNTREFSGCIVKVHIQFTIAIRITHGQPYGVILQTISSKLKLPASTLTLLTIPILTFPRVNLEDSEMEAVWNSVKDNRLTLWCLSNLTPKYIFWHFPKLLSERINVYLIRKWWLCTLMPTPEDLDFKQGNVIKSINDEWLEGQCNGKIGIFPSSFVKALNGDELCE